MKRPTRKQIILSAAAVLLLAVILFAFLPSPVSVQTATVSRSLLQVIVEEEGETRVQDRYVISSPVAAFVRRIELDPGDPIQRGQPVVHLEPPRAALLDPRARAEAGARVDAARAALAQADVVAEQTAAEVDRLERLVAGGSATQQALEQAVTEAARARGTHETARAELAAAQAAVRNAGGATTLPVQGVIRAPVTGRVLVVRQPREGHVNPGEPLLEVGDTERLEVAVDVLSQDAVRIRPGTRVLLEQWGGDMPIGEGETGARLEAVVRRVEPEGFTRVSALGVEEQRVTVIADPVVTLAATLGAGYRVLARFVVWEGADVLQLPTAALFRHQDGWAVFVIERGRARLRPASIGHQAGLATQIIAGLTEGDVVVVHPPTELEDGARVRPEE